MKLAFPKKKEEYDRLNLPIIPTRLGQPSPYKMVACAYSGFDIYICFTGDQRDQIWIEKATSLSPNSFVCFEDMQRITNDNEFTTAHQFFIKEGFLDADVK